MDHEPIHIAIPGSPDELHPDDVTVVGGIRVTTPARTLVDLADELPRHELHEAVLQAVAMGLCTFEDIRASAERCEWRPTLPFLHSVLDQAAG